MRTETTNPGYWAVIPAAVRYAAGLPPGAKLLYAEISSLTDQRGYCFAKNAYFAELYGVSEPTVQRYLRALKAGGFIRIEDGAGGKEERKIYAGVNPLAGPPVKNDTPVKNEGGGVSKITPPNNELNKKEEQSPPKPPRGRRGAKKAPEQGQSTLTETMIARIEQYCGANKELQQAILDFADNRKAIGKPILTEATVTRLLKTLDRLSQGNDVIKVAILDKAILRNWQGLFPLREDEMPGAISSAGRREAARTVEAPEEVERW